MKKEIPTENKKLYDILILGLPLTKFNLLENGLSTEEIDTLLNNKVITKIDIEDIYRLTDVVDFRYYGIYLLSTNQKKEASICFEMCYELAPNNKGICIQYLLSKVIKKEYHEVFNMFKKLEELNITNSQTNNLILYLLNMITELPEEYQERVDNLELKDLILCPNIKNDPESELRRLIWNGKFKYAYQRVNDIINSREDYTVTHELIKELLNQIIFQKRILTEELCYYIENKDYKKIVDILRKIQLRRNLTNIETYIILIADAIVKVKETGTIPTVYDVMGFDMYNLLINNNFKTALRESQIFVENPNVMLQSLLIDLNKLISDIEEFNINPEEAYNNAIEAAEGFIWKIKELGMTIEDGCRYFNLNTYMVLLIRLLYARDNYTEPNKKMFFDQIKQIPNLSSNIIRLLNETYPQQEEIKHEAPKKKRKSHIIRWHFG